VVGESFQGVKAVSRLSKALKVATIGAFDRNENYRGHTLLIGAEPGKECTFPVKMNASKQMGVWSRLETETGD